MAKRTKEEETAYRKDLRARQKAENVPPMSPDVPQSQIGASEMSPACPPPVPLDQSATIAAMKAQIDALLAAQGLTLKKTDAEVAKVRAEKDAKIADLMKRIPGLKTGTAFEADGDAPLTGKVKKATNDERSTYVGNIKPYGMVAPNIDTSEFGPEAKLRYEIDLALSGARGFRVAKPTARQQALFAHLQSGSDKVFMFDETRGK